MWVGCLFGFCAVVLSPSPNCQPIKTNMQPQVQVRLVMLTRLAKNAPHRQNVTAARGKPSPAQTNQERRKSKSRVWQSMSQTSKQALKQASERATNQPNNTNSRQPPNKNTTAKPSEQASKQAGKQTRQLTTHTHTIKPQKRQPTDKHQGFPKRNTQA